MHIQILTILQGPKLYVLDGAIKTVSGIFCRKMYNLLDRKSINNYFPHAQKNDSFEF